jgi:hypothetical protein
VRASGERFACGGSGIVGSARAAATVTMRWNAAARQPQSGQRNIALPVTYRRQRSQRVRERERLRRFDLHSGHCNISVDHCFLREGAR